MKKLLSKSAKAVIVPASILLGLGAYLSSGSEAYAAKGDHLLFSVGGFSSIDGKVDYDPTTFRFGREWSDNYFASSISGLYSHSKLTTQNGDFGDNKEYAVEVDVKLGTRRKDPVSVYIFGGLGVTLASQEFRELNVDELNKSVSAGIGIFFNIDSGAGLAIDYKIRSYSDLGSFTFTDGVNVGGFMATVKYPF